MVVVSYSGKEINAKLVYYGPGLSGKTTNLEHIYQSVPSSSRGKMVSMKTRTERTLFFDFLPIDLGDIGGFKTRFLLYTVPGQVYYNATRKLVLRGVDAVIFVADSGRGKMEENIESLQNLRENLREYGMSLDEMPWVIQYNKRDLPDAYSIEELEAALNPGGTPYYEAVATGGQGVFEAFKGIARLLLNKLSSEIKLGSGPRASAAASTPPPATGDETVTRTPPPGLMAGGVSPRAYRPPVPKGSSDAPSSISPRPPSLPTPPRRPQAPSAPSTPGQPAASRGGYRPPVPGARQEEPAAPPSGHRFRAPEPPRAPVTPVEEEVEAGGASWFGEDESPTVAMERPITTPEEDQFAPTLELDAPSFPAPAGAAAAQDDWTGMETETDDMPSRDAAPYGTGDRDPFAPKDEALERAESLARRFQGAEETEPLPPLPDLDAEQSPGFWGRLFRRRKDTEETSQYRRYPSRLDMPAGSMTPPSPVAPHDMESEPMMEETLQDFEPMPTPTLSVPLPAARPERPGRPSWSEISSAEADVEPVVIERTVEVPVTLGPEALRRGAVLRLTLELRIEPSRGRGDLSSFEDTEAA